MRSLELRIPPLVVSLLFAAAIGVLAVASPIANVPFVGQRAASAVLVALGIVVGVAGVLEFRRAKTTVNPLTPDKASSMVVSGIYRITRNPMYLGMALVLLGGAAWTSSLLGYSLVPLFCLYITRFQIVPEERALLAAFGDEFAVYQSRVRRWL